MKPFVEAGLSHQGACVAQQQRRDAESGGDGESFCYVFDNLEGDTLYGFRIRAWNYDIDIPSDWSQLVNITTPIVVTEPVTAVTPVPGSGSDVKPTQPVSDNSSQKNPDNADGVSGGDGSSYNNPLILVACLLLGLLLIAVLVTCLVYKLKIVRLKQQMRNEELWNQNRDITDMSLSASYIGGSSINTRLSDISAYATISAGSLNSSFNSEIQRRRLPEPPPIKPSQMQLSPVKNRADGVEEHEYSDAYELERLPPGYHDMSQDNRNLESTRIQVIHVHFLY